LLCPGLHDQIGAESFDLFFLFCGGAHTRTAVLDRPFDRSRGKALPPQIRDKRRLATTASIFFNNAIHRQRHGRVSHVVHL